MKSKLLNKTAVLFAGLAFMFGLSNANAGGNGRKVDKAFVNEMKIVDPAYAANIKQDNLGNFLDYNKVGLADIAKKKYENQKIVFTADDLKIPANEAAQKASLAAIPAKIDYLKQSIKTENNSVSKFEMQKELVRLEKIKSILNSQK